MSLESISNQIEQMLHLNHILKQKKNILDINIIQLLWWLLFLFLNTYTQKV